MITITLNEGKRSFSLLKRILHYTRCTMTESRLNDLALMAHYWENHWNVLQANPRKLKFKRVGEYVEEISFFLLLVKIYFLIMLWIDLVSCDGVSDKEIESLEQNQIFKPQYLYPML